MRLREIRENTNKTQTEVAKYLGVTRQAYNNYELGNRQLNPDMLDKLADYFNVSVHYLLGRENKPANSELAKEPTENVIIYHSLSKFAVIVSSSL